MFSGVSYVKGEKEAVNNKNDNLPASERRRKQLSFDQNMVKESTLVPK